MRAIAVGSRFGRYVVVSGQSDRGKHHVLCRCDCGNERAVYRYSLLSGDAKSCGCFRRELTAKNKTTHGLRHTPEYDVWHGMLMRCHNPKKRSFADYGARGIIVCDRWRESFAAFYADMGQRPSPAHTIERRNNDGPYEPSNCYWATRATQNANTRKNHRLTVNGETHHLAEWARRSGLSHATIIRRLSLGWSIERTLTEAPKFGPRFH